jgi:hypothetical protein
MIQGKQGAPETYLGLWYVYQKLIEGNEERNILQGHVWYEKLNISIRAIHITGRGGP